VSATRYSYLDHTGPVPFAHRGGAREAPENSWGAFEKAIRTGYRYLETDTRATTDGVAVCFHDATLERVTDQKGRLRDLSWAELSTVRLADGRGIPRLDEVLSAWPSVRWNIDIKDGTALEPVLRTLAACGAQSRVLVTSFSDLRIAAARRRMGPDLATGLGAVGIARLRALSAAAARREKTSEPDKIKRTPASVVGTGAAAQVPVKCQGITVVDSTFIAAAHSRGLAVHVWTVDDAATMGELLDLGVDGIMTDRPTLLRSVLEERGQWREQPGCPAS
jgi:glycerophosphoryl diester phosphodiesterase